MNLYTVYHYKLRLLEMKSRFKKIQIILVIAISFTVPISSAYVCYYTVAAADFLSPNLNFETFDQEFLFAAYENESKVFVLSSFLNGPPPDNLSIRTVFPFLFQNTFSRSGNLNPSLLSRASYYSFLINLLLFNPFN